MKRSHRPALVWRTPRRALGAWMYNAVACGRVSRELRLCPRGVLDGVCQSSRDRRSESRSPPYLLTLRPAATDNESSLLDDSYDLRRIHLRGFVVATEPEEGAVLIVPLGNHGAQVLVRRAHRHRYPRERGAVIAGDALPDLVDGVFRFVVARVDVRRQVDDVRIIRVERSAAQVVFFPPVGAVTVKRAPALHEARRLPLFAVEP